MPNNSNVKLGMYDEPISVGDWCIYKNVLCKVIKVNEKRVTLMRLAIGADEDGTIMAWKISVSPENIFIIAKDACDMPRYLNKKMTFIEEKEELKKLNKRP